MAKEMVEAGAEVKPKPIKIRTWSKRKLEIRVVGFKDKSALPYLIVETEDKDLYGYIEDIDVHRLKKWCDDCLRGKK